MTTEKEHVFFNVGRKKIPNAPMVYFEISSNKKQPLLACFKLPDQAAFTNNLGIIKGSA